MLTSEQMYWQKVFDAVRAYNLDKKRLEDAAQRPNAGNTIQSTGGSALSHTQPQGITETLFNIEDYK